MTEMPLRQAPNVWVQDVLSEICLLRLDTGSVAVLNRTATDTWLLIDEKSTLDEIAEQLAASYGRPVGEIRADVTGAVVELTQRGFLVSTCE